MLSGRRPTGKFPGMMLTVKANKYKKIQNQVTNLKLASGLPPLVIFTPR